MAYRDGADWRAMKRARLNHETIETVPVMVSRALDVIEASAEPVISISELVRATNIPERTLRAAFKKYLGMSPFCYMQLRMLNKARQRLTASEPTEISVAEVATDLGVWDLGRFAARYRRVFGELPSSTLRNTN